MSHCKCHFTICINCIYIFHASILCNIEYFCFCRVITIWNWNRNCNCSIRLNDISFCIQQSDIQQWELLIVKRFLYCIICISFSQCCYFQLASWWNYTCICLYCNRYICTGSICYSRIRLISGTQCCADALYGPVKACHLIICPHSLCGFPPCIACLNCKCMVFC